MAKIQVSGCADSWRQAWDNVLPNKLSVADWLHACSAMAESVSATVEVTCASLPCLTAHWYTVAQVRGLLALPPCGMAVHFPDLSKHQPWYAH
jgi:hypothetical protein